jgi:hypothetical protein
MNHGIEEGEVVQTKGIRNIFTNQIFTNLDKEMPTQVQEASRTPDRQGQNRTSSW